MPNTSPPRRTQRVRDLVSHRNLMTYMRKNIRPNFDVEMDTVTAVWNDPFGNGRSVLTANGHLINSEKRVGETIVLIRKGRDYVEVG